MYQRSPFLLLNRLARREFEDVDRLVTWSEQTQRARSKLLERLTPSVADQFSEDVAEIDAFARLYAECSVLALWRCVELFRKRVIALAIGAVPADGVFRHKEFCRMLKQLGIGESALRCAKSVKELRCLNNALKHEGKVGGDLAALPRWKRRNGQRIGNPRAHYVRLRPLAQRYVDDLTKRATSWWERQTRTSRRST